MLVKVIEPDMSIVNSKQEEDMSLVDCLHYDRDKTDWSFIANNFVIKDEASSKTKKRVGLFIRGMHAAKIATERKLRG